MDAESPSESARQVARLSLAFEDMAADIRRGAQAGGLTLSEVRLLDGVLRGISEARTLSRCLRLDEGHVSRMVKRLRTAGLLVGRRQRGDGRRVTLSLTGEGALRLGQAIEGAACAAEATLGDELSGAGSVVGMALETMLDRMPPSDEIRLTPLQPGDPGWVVSQHGLLYARDEGFDSSFEATVARVVSDFMLTRDPSRESAWIAPGGDGTDRLHLLHGRPRRRPTTAQLRLFLVRPEWRRRGVGHRLLAACRDFAAKAGYEELLLHTHAEHRAAVRLYAASGFTCIGNRNVTAYGRELTEQIWLLPLDAPLAKPFGHR